jgi:hypothetical protein
MKSLTLLIIPLLVISPTLAYKWFDTFCFGDHRKESPIFLVKNITTMQIKSSEYKPGRECKRWY